MSALLARADDRALFVSGCVSNQGRFNRFDAIVLLSAPAEVILERIRKPGDEQLREDERRARPDLVPPRLGRATPEEDVQPRNRRGSAAADVVEKLVEIGSAG
jgi:hypothetical protein